MHKFRDASSVQIAQKSSSNNYKASRNIKMRRAPLDKALVCAPQKFQVLFNFKFNKYRTLL